MFKRVLLVDDALFMRKMIGDILKNSGYEIAGEAENGRDAIDKFIELKPDIIFMDITMPDIDGIHAVREIKKVDASAKIVMCSAMGQDAFVKDALKAGASDFISKPFQPSRILETAQRVLLSKMPTQ